MNINQLQNEIKEKFLTQFPHSRIFIKYGGFARTIWINCFLSEDNSECSNGIIHNDMFKISFEITSSEGYEFSKDVNLESELGEVALESHSNHYTILSDDSRLYCDHKKVSFRKSVGTPEKIIQSLDKFFIKLKLSVSEDIQNTKIHRDFVSIVLQKIGG